MVKTQCGLAKEKQKEKKEFNELSKNEKGLQAALHMVKNTVPQFMQVKESMNQSHTFDKKEVLESEADMLKRFGEAEFKAHVASGRIAWREDPWTYDVYNYHDRSNMSKSVKVRKEKSYSRGHEYQPNEEDNDEWDSLWHLDAASRLQQAERWGKGKALTRGKGDPKGKGKGKGKGNQLALEDGSPHDDDDGEEGEEKDEETQWKELLQKTKRARDQCTAARADCEAALEKADKAKRLTKTVKKETEGLLQNMAAKVDALKNLLANKDKSVKLTKAKKVLAETATQLKEMKDETKELNQMANKAGSKSSAK